jgi:hypothetical protein
MGRVIGRIFSFVLLAWIVTVVAAVVGAMQAKQRQGPPPAPDADDLNLTVAFGPLEHKSEARAFRGGFVECWFGGGSLDLRDATLDPSGAVLTTRTFFGGGELIVPDDWRVETRVVGIGGAGDARPAMDRPADAPTLRLEGIAMFGGWGIVGSGQASRRAQEVSSTV